MTSAIGAESVERIGAGGTPKARQEIVELLTTALRRAAKVRFMVCVKTVPSPSDSLAIPATQSVHGVDSRLP